MELSIRSLVLLATVVLTGLSAGFFYAWSVSVIPGTQKIAHSAYLESMQSINRGNSESGLLHRVFWQYGIAVSRHLHSIRS